MCVDAEPALQLLGITLVQYPDLLRSRHKKCLLQFEGLGSTECKQKNKAGLRTALVVPYLRCSNPPLSHLFSG